MSDGDLKVNCNIYPDAVTRDRMRLVGPKSGQLGSVKGRSSFHLSVLESVYIKTQNPVLCR